MAYTPGHASHHVRYVATLRHCVGATRASSIWADAVHAAATPRRHRYRSWARDFQDTCMEPEKLYHAIWPHKGASDHIDRVEPPERRREMAAVAARARAGRGEVREVQSTRSLIPVRPGAGGGYHGVRGPARIQLARHARYWPSALRQPPRVRQAKNTEAQRRNIAYLWVRSCGQDLYSASPSPALSGSRNTHTRLMSAEIAM